jgi:DNA repair exonuclease SbcCD nuclease subunit
MNIEPYQFKIPGEVIPISKDRIEMDKKVNEHFSMVTVTTGTVTNLFQEVSTRILSMVWGGSFEKSPILSEQQKKVEERCNKSVYRSKVSSGGARRSFQPS